MPPHTPLKLLAWNILHGGGPARMPEIALALIAHTPDIVVLTEFRHSRGGQLRGILGDRGLIHHAATRTSGRTNGVLVASRFPLDHREDRFDRAASDGRWIDLRLPTLDLSLSGVHIPDDSRPEDKAAYWNFLIRLGRERRGERWVVLGDLNSGRHHIDEPGRTFRHTRLLGTFTSLGFRDAWRTLHPAAREFSWYSHEGRGFRIDGAFLSPMLHKCLKSAEFSHLERESGVSDHSLLVVEMELPMPAATGDAEQKSCASGDAKPCFSALFLPESGTIDSIHTSEPSNSPGKTSAPRKKYTNSGQKTLFPT